MQFSNNNKLIRGHTISPMRLPLFLRITIVGLLLAGLFIGVSGRFFWQQHKKALFTEKLQSVGNLLDFLAVSVKIPLLTDDTLRLSSMVHDAVKLEGIVNASVLDRNKVVQAQMAREGFEWKGSLLESGNVLSNNSGIVIVQYSLSPVEQVYDLSREIIYHEKPLGIVHLGLSASFVTASLNTARSTLTQICLGLGAGMILLLLFIGALYTRQVKKRSGELVRAAEEYGNGNLQYRIENLGNGVWGDVGRALHHMSQGLLLQEPSQAKLEQYLKFSSLDRILESPQSEGGAHAFRRQVAILFASIQGFGSYAETEHPEEIVKALNKYIAILTRIISKHGGYVDKVIGDAIVGIFGVSLYREDHTTRAIRAALDLQEALSAGDKSESQLLSKVSVGISSGIVLSGNIGTYSKVEYSSIGESIKEAYWLSNFGHPGEIILGEEIYGPMKTVVEVETLPPQNVLGSSDVIKSYRLLGFSERNSEHE